MNKKTSNHKNKLQEGMAIFFLVWMIISSVFLIIGLFTLGSSLYFKLNAKEAEALVIGIKSSSVDIDGDQTKIAHIKYVVNDKEYNERIDYVSGMTVGKKTHIYYDQNDPDQVSTLTNIPGSLIFATMGAIFFGSGLFVIRKFSNIDKNIKNLKENGIKKDAYIENVTIDESFPDDNISLYVINCKLVDENGVVTLISSDYCQKNPQPIIDSLQTKSLPTYIDRANSKNYYIDTSIIDDHII